MEARQQSRQQFFKNTAKFNHTQPLPFLQKPQRVKSLSVSHNGKNDAAKYIPPADEVDADTLSPTTKISSSVLTGDKSDVANESPLTYQKSRPTTPISKLIQRFTSEMLNFEISSPKPQSQSSLKESLEFKPIDNTHTSRRSTADSSTQSSTVFPSLFQSDTIMQDIVKATATAVPFKPPNLVKPTKTSVQQSNTEMNGVALRRPSYFWGRTNSAEPILQWSLSTDIGRVTSNRTVSLMTPQTYITDSVVLGTTEHTPEVARKAQITEAVPFRPPEWVKLPVTDFDQTDVAPSQIQVLPSSSFKMAGCSSQPSFVAQPHLTRGSSFHSYPVTERSTSYDSPTSSERITGQSIQLNKVPDITSPYMTTNSRIFVSKWESPNKPEHSCGQVIRCSSTSSLTSFRRSKMPSIPVKSLVKKFSTNN
jgi:hypothetical protein